MPEKHIFQLTDYLGNILENKNSLTGFDQEKAKLLAGGVLFVSLTGFLIFTGFQSNLWKPDIEPSIQGEIVNVTLTDTRPEPFRPTISPEDGVRFTNNAQYSYNFSFESERLEGFVIEPGESRVVDVKSIAYYTAEPLNSSARDVKGGVNVDY
jgi:hypothetical protein